jgi:DNA recombination-dependent growth factor C
MRIKASGSFRRYFYHGPALGDDDLLARLTRLRFQDIDQQPTAAYAGWITLRSLVDTHFDDEIWRAHYACFALRIDRKRLPKNALKVRMLERLRAEPGKANQQRKRELKDQIIAELMPRLVPATSAHQVLWDRRRGEVYLGTTADDDHLQFLNLFRETFDTSLIPVVPATLADRISLAPALKARLGTLMPSTLIETAQGDAA